MLGDLGLDEGSAGVPTCRDYASAQAVFGGLGLGCVGVEGVEGFRASKAYIGSKGFKGVWDLEGSRLLFMRLQ